MKIYENDEETDEYGFFCDLEENNDKYNKENYDFIIRISTPKNRNNTTFVIIFH